MSDLSFTAIGLETLRQYWPVFAVSAVIEVWLVTRIRRAQRFPVRWIVPVALVAVGLAAALWVESFLTTQLLYQTVGEGARVDPWADLRAHVRRSLPLLAALGVVLFGLARRPRSESVIAGLVAAAGVLVSWTAAMWLFLTNHQPAVFTLLVLPGGLGVVASVIGTMASLALWMAIGRWIWKEGRRRRRRPPPPGPDVILLPPGRDAAV